MRVNPFLFCAFAANNIRSATVASQGVVELSFVSSKKYRLSLACVDRTFENVEGNDPCHSALLLEKNITPAQFESCQEFGELIWAAEGPKLNLTKLRRGRTEVSVEGGEYSLIRLVGGESNQYTLPPWGNGNQLTEDHLLLEDGEAEFHLGINPNPNRKGITLKGLYRASRKGSIPVIQPYINLPLVLKASSQACSLKLQPYPGAYEDWEEGEASMSKSSRVWRYLVMRPNATDIYAAKTVEHLANSLQSSVDRFFFKTVYTADGIDDLMKKLTALLPAPHKTTSEAEEWVPGRCQMVFQRVVRISRTELCKNGQDRTAMYGAALQLADEELPRAHATRVSTRIRGFIVRDAPPQLRRFSYAALPAVMSDMRLCFGAKGVTQLGADIPVLPFGSNGVMLQMPDLMITRTFPRIGLLFQEENGKTLLSIPDGVLLDVDALIEYEVVV